MKEKLLPIINLGLKDKISEMSNELSELLNSKSFKKLEEHKSIIAVELLGESHKKHKKDDEDDNSCCDEKDDNDKDDDEKDDDDKDDLSPKQKRIAALAGDKDKIDSEDFQKLRSKTNEALEIPSITKRKANTHFFKNIVSKKRKPSINPLLKKESVEDLEEECSNKVRSEYVKHYANANKKGMNPTKATEYAYSKIRQNHGEDVLNSLKSHHDTNMKESLEEKHMTSGEKAKEKKLKSKFDPSEMKQKMIDQYGEEKGKQVYFAKIRKMAMGESLNFNIVSEDTVEINEARIHIPTLKKHFYSLSNKEFSQRYGHPKHIIRKAFGW